MLQVIPKKSVDLPPYHDEPFETSFVWWRDNEVAPICSINKDFELDEPTGYKMIVYAFCDYIYRDELIAFNRGTGRKCFYPLLGGRLWLNLIILKKLLQGGLNIER